MTYTKRVLIAIDRLANVLAGGKVGETLSSRAWREQWKLRPWIDRSFGKLTTANSRTIGTAILKTLCKEG